jgi:hypothetical protein
MGDDIAVRVIDTRDTVLALVVGPDGEVRCVTALSRRHQAVLFRRLATVADRKADAAGEPPLPTCPECVQGKHGNCDGTAWDFETDKPTACKCAEAGHR